MKQPVKYFQIFYFASDETIHPLNTKAFNEPDPYFNSFDEAETFVKSISFDSQQGNKPEDKDTVLTILPLFVVKMKTNQNSDFFK